MDYTDPTINGITCDPGCGATTLAVLTVVDGVGQVCPSCGRRLPTWLDSIELPF